MIAGPEVARGSRGDGPAQRGVDERPNLDRRIDREGDLRGPLDGGVEVAGLDDVEASKLLLGLRIWTVDGADPAIRWPDDAGLARFAQSAAEDKGIRRSHLTLEAFDLFEPATHVLFGHRLANLACGHVDGQKVPAHRGLLWRPGWSRPLVISTNDARSGRHFRRHENGTPRRRDVPCRGLPRCVSS